MKGIDTTFFDMSTLKLPVGDGDLLVAQPFMDEAWFKCGVITVIDYDSKEGTTGVVLNNAMNYTLPDVLDGVNSAVKVPVYCGGPVSQDRLYFIHTLGDEILPGARRYAPGLYIGGDFDAAMQYVNEGYPTEGIIRFFIGYSGWSPGQLEQEIEENTWAVLKSPQDPQSLLRGSGPHYWHRAVAALGPHYRPWRHIPADTHAN